MLKFCEEERMQIVVKKISELKNYENNARTHSKDKIDEIVKSIKNFGFCDPIEIDGNNVIISGHARAEAAALAGFLEVPTICHTHLTENAKKAYILAANKIAQKADWDFSLLKTEFEDLIKNNFDIELTGFSANEIDQLLTPFELNNDLIDLDDDIQKKENTKTKQGDIWLLGAHRLMCADSYNTENVKSLIGNSKIDLIFTDPMYNDDYQNLINAFYAINCDHILLVCTARQMIEIVKNSTLNFKFDCVLKYKTPSSMMNKKTPYYLHKNLCYLTKTEESIFNCDYAKGCFSENGYYPSVIEAKKNTQEAHGLTKPTDAIIKILSGYKAKKILDLFGGSGSTVLACEKMGKQSFVIELSEQYCDIIIERWQKFTGKKAILESTGEFYEE